MRRTSAISKVWPFWLLIVAWVCANSPQSGVFAVLTWLNEARHFSHQQRLTADVAFLLVGEKPSALMERATEKMPSRPLPVLPAETALKKIELGLEKTAGFLAPALRGARPEVAAVASPDWFRAPPLLGPPRVTVPA